jgi:hypothetical protein
MNEPLEIPEPVTLFAVLKYGDEKEVCGILNVMERSMDASTSSQLPPEQSQPDTPAS